jgi:anti-sigma factor ChrR (cupin superfamily)
MNPDDACFCDLAPLYALDLLTASDRHIVEAQLAESPELATELADFQTAVTALAYTTPVVSMADNLKDRLFQSLGQTTPVVEPLPASLEETFAGFVVKATDIVWQPHPVPGVTIVNLHVDPSSRTVVGLLKAEPGMQYPWHTHAATEEIFMLEGDLVIADQVYGPGDYIFSPPGSGHAPSSVHGCKFYFRTSMDDRYPNARKSKARSRN